MPLPTRNKDESAKDFVSRCMSSEVMNKEFPEANQRVAVCTDQSRAAASELSKLEQASEEIVYKQMIDSLEDLKPINKNKGG